MIDHALKTYVWAVANDKNVRKYTKDVLAGNDDHLTKERLDRYIARLRAKSVCGCKIPGFSVSEPRICPTCHLLHRKETK